MNARDRLLISAFALIALLAASWYLLLAPKRADLAALDIKLGAAQARVTAAQATLSEAQSAKSSYPTDYTTVAKLGKAIPADDDVASLLVQLQTTAYKRKIFFDTIAVSGGSAAAAAAAATSSASATAAAALPPGASVGAAGFPTMPFTFSFLGQFFKLEKFFDGVQKYTTVEKDGTIDVRGRLLSIDGFSLKPEKPQSLMMRAKVSATAYVLPADEATPTATATTPVAAATAGTDPTATPGGTTSTTPGAAVSENTTR